MKGEILCEGQTLEVREFSYFLFFSSYSIKNPSFFSFCNSYKLLDLQGTGSVGDEVQIWTRRSCQHL